MLWIILCVCVCVCVFLSYCNLWASLVAQLVDNPPAIQETLFNSWVWKIACTRDRLPISVFLGFPHGSDGKKKSSCNAGEYVSESHSVMSNSLWPMDCSLSGSSILGILQERILEWVAVPFSRGSSLPRDQIQVAMQQTWVRGVAKSRTWLSN